MTKEINNFFFWVGVDGLAFLSYSRKSLYLRKSIDSRLRRQLLEDLKPSARTVNLTLQIKYSELNPHQKK